MTKPLIHFDETQLAFHKRMTLQCVKAYGNMVEVPFYSSLNETPGPGQHLGMVLVNLEKILSQVIQYSPEFHKETSEKISSPRHQSKFSSIEEKPVNKEHIIADYYHILLRHYVKSMTLCSYIVQALEEYKDTLEPSNPQVYHEVIAYYSLFACLLAYNSIVLNHDFAEHDIVKSLFDAIHKWMFLLESAYLQHNQDPQFHQLHQLFLNKFSKLKRKMAQDKTSLALLPEALDFHVSRKNKRAKEYGSPFSGRVVLKPDSSHVATIDMEAIHQFINAMQDLQAATIKRQQILFYPHHNMGAVELFDVEWDDNENIFNIIYVHAGRETLQYQLLQQLKQQLDSQHIPHQVLACQADIQHRGNDSSAMLAYALSGILSHHSFKKLQQSDFVSAQPSFYDFLSKDAQDFPVLDKVTWCSVNALGTKAIMMANPTTQAQYQKMLARLTTIVPQSELNGVLQIFRKKFQVQNNPSKPHVRHFVENFHMRLRKRAQDELFCELSLEDVMQQLETTKPGQAMRRAAAGMAQVDTFDYLLTQFSTLSIDDNPINEADSIEGKRFTPLHLCLQKEHASASRAVKLLRAHAKSDVKDASPHQHTAFDLYEQADEDSEIKRNPVLKAIFKG